MNVRFVSDDLGVTRDLTLRRRRALEQALGVGVEFDIGAGDSEKDFPVIESPSENHFKIII